jgi:hypothetical protein
MINLLLRWFIPDSFRLGRLHFDSCGSCYRQIRPFYGMPMQCPTCLHRTGDVLQGIGRELQEASYPQSPGAEDSEYSDRPAPYLTEKGTVATKFSNSTFRLPAEAPFSEMVILRVSTFDSGLLISIGTRPRSWS